MKLLAVLATLVVFISSPVSAADCSPSSVLKIVTVNASPSVPKDGYAAKPKVLYRLGNKFARIEEELDDTNKIQGLIVVSQPDSWIVNLAAESGRHVVDPEVGGVVRVPVFQPEDFGDSFPKVLRDLEFGCEVAFYDGHGSPVTDFKTPDGPMVKQALGVGAWTSVLLRKTKSSPPAMIFLLHDDKVVFVLKYVVYEPFEGDAAKLFAKPTGIKFVEPAA